MHAVLPSALRSYYIKRKSHDRTRLEIRWGRHTENGKDRRLLPLILIKSPTKKNITNQTRVSQPRILVSKTLAPKNLHQ